MADKEPVHHGVPEKHIVEPPPKVENTEEPVNPGQGEPHEGTEAP